MIIKNPQTKCMYLAAHAPKLPAIANFGCLAFCYLKCAGVDGSEVDYILNVAEAMDAGLLDNECTVLDAEKFIKHFTGRKVGVSKKNIDVAGVKEIRDPTPVRYDYNGSSHWVVVQNGSVVFNPMINSVCVNKGKPTTARVIKWI